MAKNFFGPERRSFNPAGNLSDAESKKLAPEFRRLAKDFTELSPAEQSELLRNISALRDALKDPVSVMGVAKNLVGRSLSSARARKVLDELFTQKPKPVSEIDPVQFDRELGEFEEAVRAANGEAPNFAESVEERFDKRAADAGKRRGELWKGESHSEPHRQFNRRKRDRYDTHQPRA